MKKGKFNLYEFIYENFKLSINHLKNIKNYLLVSVVLFFSSILFGFLFPKLFEKQILKLLSELVKQTEGLGFLELIKFIFINNLQSSFSAMFFGILLGIVPLIVCLMNGYVLGFVINKSVLLEGYLILWRLFPHGIFEIPAVMISISLGISFGFNFATKIYKKYFSKSFSFSIFILLAIFFLPFTLVFLSLVFLFFLYYNYINYYFKRRKFIFLISSILIFPIMAFNLILNRNLKTILNEDCINSFRAFIFIVVPLLILAGIIEGSLIWIIG